MGEIEVIVFLEKHKGKYFSLKEIADAINAECNMFSTTKVVKKLAERKEIKCMRVDVNLARKMYGGKIKRGLNLYFLS